MPVYELSTLFFSIYIWNAHQLFDELTQRKKKGEMGPGTDVWPQCASLDNRYLKECVAPVEDDDDEAEDSDNVNQPNAAKPPRSIQPMRHCISQAMLAGTSDSVSD